MKKTYTILFLSTAILAFAQESKVIEEASKEGYYFKQSGDVIELWKGYPSSANNNKSSFSSPNEVRISKDAKGNKYWSIIDGTVVKAELVSNSTSVKSEYKEPVKIETVNENIDQIPKQETKPLETEKTEIKISKPAFVDSVSVSKPETPAGSKVKELVPPTEPVDLPKVEEKKEEDPKVFDLAPVEEKNTIVEEVSPKEEASKIDATNESKEVINNDPNEEIKVEKEDVGDVTDLFEKNYENMTGKEKKLYRKNERRIMKQLEAELKKQRKEEK